MHDPAFDFYHEKKKKEAKEVYDKIGRVWCPALNDNVFFNDIGFRHFTWKGNSRKRSHIQQVKRFVLISRAKEIVSNPSFVIFSQREEVKKGRHVHFWAFRMNLRGKYIRVVIRQINDSSKHFLSVFEEDKQKAAHT
jgi:hypothetical protein